MVLINSLKLSNHSDGAIGRHQLPPTASEVEREKENATKPGQASPARAEAVVMAFSPAPRQTIVFCDAHSKDEHAIDILC
jgi:hypothetical protein